MKKFYMYRNAETAEVIIENSTLKFTNPANFNDPFDFYPMATEKGLLKFIDRIEKENGNGKRTIRRNHVARQKHLAHLRSPEYRNNYLEKVSIACFSKSQYILPMWAHYADNHKGCVLEFSYNNSDETLEKYSNTLTNEYFDTLVPHDVDYSDERPCIYDKDGNTNKPVNGSDVFLRKAKIWEYEQEVRVVQMHPEGIYPFDPEQLSGIYFGMKIGLTEKRKISKLIDSQNIVRKKKIRKHDMQIAFNKFEIFEVPFRL